MTPHDDTMTHESPPPLVHRWLVEVITNVAPLTQSLAAAAARLEATSDLVDRIVRASPSQTASDRVGVYHGMYLSRMTEALESDFPALSALMGHARFHALVADYVAVHPSTSYTLNRLGDALPAFLATRARRPSEVARAELAALEHAISQSFDAQPGERLSASALAAAAADDWSGLCLRPQPGLRLIRTRFDAGVALDALRNGERVRTPPRRWAHTVVFRNGDEVRRMNVTRAAFDVLAALAHGEPLGDALERAPARAGAAVSRWFESWVAGGLFEAAERKPVPADDQNR